VRARRRGSGEGLLAWDEEQVEECSVLLNSIVLQIGVDNNDICIRLKRTL